MTENTTKNTSETECYACENPATRTDEDGDPVCTLHAKYAQENKTVETPRIENDPNHDSMEPDPTTDMMDNDPMDTNTTDTGPAITDSSAAPADTGPEFTTTASQQPKQGYEVFQLATDFETGEPIWLPLDPDLRLVFETMKDANEYAEAETACAREFYAVFNNPRRVTLRARRSVLPPGNHGIMQLGGRPYCWGCECAGVATSTHHRLDS